MVLQRLVSATQGLGCNFDISPKITHRLVANRQGRRKSQVFKAVEVPRPGLWLGAFFTSSLCNGDYFSK